ncbi:hypothetical protein BH09PSE6_BH09PSE6_26250 [soil metagenome]
MSLEREAVEWLSQVLTRSTANLKDGLEEVQRAHVAARLANQDERAQVLACLAICMIVGDFGSFMEMEIWADQLADGVLEPDRFEPNARLICAAGALALHQFAPASVGIPNADGCVALYRATLRSSFDVVDPNVLVATIDHVSGYLSNVGEQALLEQLHGNAEPVLDDPRLDPKVRGRWLFWLGVSYWHVDSRVEAEAAWSRALGAPGVAAWPWLRFHLKRVVIRPVLEDGNYQRATRQIDELETLLDYSRPIDLSDYHHLRGWLSLALGDMRVARQHLELAIEGARRANMSRPAISVPASALAQTMLCDGREDDGVAMYEQLSFPLCARGDAQKQSGIAFCLAAKARRLGNKTEYTAQLTTAFRCSREQGMLRIIRYAPWMAAQFCADALRHGIEPEFVLRVIESRGLQPPPGAGAAWPWRVKILTCQPFAVVVDSQPLELEGKTRTKPLALLRLLAAQSGGPVAVARVCDWLWPDQEPAQARGSFDVTLNRLRAMLNYKDALMVGDGRVSLSETIVWLDTRALTHASRRCADSMQIATASQRRPLFEQLLQCHERPFLEVDEEEPWAVEARGRYQALFAHSVEALVRAADFEGGHDEANWMRGRSGLHIPAAPALRLVVSR